MSQNDKNTIDLSKYQNPAAKILTGRPWGRAVREKSRIDEIEADNPELFIVIPDGLKTIGPSFFEELFKTVIRKLGKEAFLEKVKFINLGEYQYQTPLYEAIDRVLRKKTALD